jgi:hypothetical protein
VFCDLCLLQILCSTNDIFIIHGIKYAK